MRHKLMSAGRLALFLCLAATTPVACATHQPMSADAAGATHASAATGRLTGRLITVGGPAPGAAHPVAGKVTVSGDRVHVDVAVGQDGAYAVSLPPGRYQVTGHSPSVVVDDGEMLCRSSKSARVSSGAVAVLDAICPIK